MCTSYYMQPRFTLLRRTFTWNPPQIHSASVENPAEVRLALLAALAFLSLCVHLSLFMPYKENLTVSVFVFFNVRLLGILHTGPLKSIIHSSYCTFMPPVNLFEWHTFGPKSCLPEGTVFPFFTATYVCTDTA